MVRSAGSTHRQLAQVDVKGKLIPDEVEHLVLGRRLHEVCAGADVVAGAAGSDELERQSIATRGDAISARVVGAVDDAVGRACLVVGAESRIPGVAGVACWPSCQST